MNERLNEAIRFAAEVHAEQKRKMTGLPYILHPMEAATIAGSLANDEDVIIAALLHDVVEDAGVSLDEIEKQFGLRVRRLVESETEDKRVGTPPGETWKIRKEESLEVLDKAEDAGIKMLWLSDKLSNVRALYTAWLKLGDNVFENFNQKEKSEHGWYYRAVAKRVSELKDTAAYREYVELIDKIFG